jgi:hypothetical protein
LDVRHELTDRVAIGADYSLTQAVVGLTQNFGIHSVDGRVEFKPAEDVTLEASAGIAALRIGESDNRSGLSWRFAAAKRAQHATLMAAYFRSFVPSFGFGGTVQNQELTAQVRAPFNRSRAYVVGGTSWRINTPLSPGEIELHSLWVNMTVGYEITRQLQIEGFYTGVFQDSQLPGGRLDRNQIGFQIVTAAPMRIH